MKFSKIFTKSYHCATMYMINVNYLCLLCLFNMKKNEKKINKGLNKYIDLYKNNSI